MPQIKQQALDGHLTVESWNDSCEGYDRSNTYKVNITVKDGIQKVRIYKEALLYDAIFLTSIYYLEQ